MPKFEVKKDFLLDGQPMKIIAGGMHYFRVVPEYWRDRLEKMKALGCNTVETYVAWNMHEPQKGKFCFEGICDIKRFLETAAELGMYAIVRPSPYICAEWEFGGLPGWLLSEDGIRVRTRQEAFLTHVRDYYKELFKILTPMQITHGGNIILFQIENEYGSYGEDEEYMKAIKAIMEENGADVPMFSSDGPWYDYLSCGGIKGVLQTANFGSQGHEQFKILKSHIGEDKPLMCSEFWVGWFDAWGDKEHNHSSIEEHMKDLDEILSEGSVSIYMFEGGTNFGFMNGANYYDHLTPDVTSYDYDALLTEDGQITKKYEGFKEIISKYVDIPEVEFTTKIERKSLGNAVLTDVKSLFDCLDEISAPVESHFALPMEKLGQNYGYILYRTELKRETEISKFSLMKANDRANVFLDGRRLIKLYDRELLQEYKFQEKNVQNKGLDILVENMGRVNYGANMDYQQKGIAGGVILNGHHHYGFRQYTLPMDNLDKLTFNETTKVNGEFESSTVPAFYRYELDVNEKADTFLDMTGFGKGCVILNGFNLGRFWEVGPQHTLYVPAPLLKEGKNEIIVFETEGKAKASIETKDEPLL
ncbi:MAG: beta-galactosidase [Lachnospiraceae bacterium]|nr:beta-galactosidase [Lachnospiraceae bacterium]